MPTLTYPPALYPQVDGDVLLSDDINRLFYDGTDAGYVNSLEIINGGLDHENIGASWEVGAEHTQRGSMIDMGGTGRTANIDWRWSWWGAFTSPGGGDWSPAPSTYPGKPIPGGAIEIYAPYAGILLLMWQCFRMNDREASGNSFSHVYMMFNGSYAANEMRQIERCCNNARTDPRGYQKARAWSGHFVTTVNAGWQSAALYALSDRTIRNTRDWATNIKYVLMNYST